MLSSIFRSVPEIKGGLLGLVQVSFQSTRITQREINGDFHKALRIGNLIPLPHKMAWMHRS